ncbi:MAG: hypothetical protein KAR19_05570 [Bacteroidales bacterium]|nr:hypothetical protein [Bacteroidales bacterium]
MWSIIGLSQTESSDNDSKIGFGFNLGGDDLYAVTFSNFGIYTGIHYAISDNISLGLNYSQGLNITDGINYETKNRSFNADNYSLRNSQLDFSLYYKFGKKRDEE